MIGLGMDIRLGGRVHLDPELVYMFPVDEEDGGQLWTGVGVHW